MTKDWESVREKIRVLSVDQKKPLQDVQKIMERKHNFKASTRAYRMRLKDWGYLRYKPRQGGTTRTRRSETAEGLARDLEESDDESDLSVIDSDERAAERPVNSGEAIPPEEHMHIVPLSVTVEAWSQGLIEATEMVMDSMLEALLDDDAHTLEQLAIKNPHLLNDPIGLPFDTSESRFFEHPKLQDSELLQHPDQRLLDIAAGLPSGAALFELMRRGANGSIHPLGMDLALYNAIRNGRAYTVQRLIECGRSYPNGNAIMQWRPLTEAVYWNFPDVVRVLLDKGADMNGLAPLRGEMSSRTALQVALHNRAREYADPKIRERSEGVLKMLLDDGANVFAPLPQDHLDSIGWFLEPWKNNPAWFVDLSSSGRGCLESFILKGVDMRTPFSAFPCNWCSANTLMHQILWHTTPDIARALVDNSVPKEEAHGCLLHEVVGNCPNASRHPTDVLRDITSLLDRQADPNLVNVQGHTPLSACLNICSPVGLVPPVDLVPRLAALLEGGADPELSANGIRPVVYAARTYEEPLQAEILEVLVSHLGGPHSSLDRTLWEDGLWPISDDVSIEDVLLYCGQNSSFENSMDRALPSDVIPSFRNAAMNVASKRFLAKCERLLSTSAVPMTDSEKYEIHQVITLRRINKLPEYKFSQNFVMALMRSHWNTTLQAGDTPMTDISGQVPTQYDFQSVSSIGVPISQSTSGASAVFPAISGGAAQFHTTHRRGSHASKSSGGSEEFVPATVQVLWRTSNTTVYEEGDPAKMVGSDT